MTSRLTPLLAVIAAVAVAAAAYAGGRQSTPTSAAPHGPRVAVPMPKHNRVLTLSGAIDNANAGRRLVLDVRALERMGVTSVTVHDPFKKRDARFRGIPLGNLLDVAMVRSGATTLHASALDEYSVDIPIDVARGDGVYLATRNGDGSPISVAKGGPLRVVFLGDAKYKGKIGYWIWSVNALDVR